MGEFDFKRITNYRVLYFLNCWINLLHYGIILSSCRLWIISLVRKDILFLREKMKNSLKLNMDLKIIMKLVLR